MPSPTSYRVRNDAVVFTGIAGSGGSPSTGIAGAVVSTGGVGYDVPCDQAGESCPRQRALESGRYERALHVHHTARGEEYVQVDLYPLRDHEGHISLFVERMRTLPAARTERSSHGLVGRAPAFMAMMELVSRVSSTDTTVLSAA